MVGAKGKISLSALPSSDNGEYDFVESAGAGVQVYVMDTGIRTTHTLFGGRAVNFQGLQSTDKSPYTDEVMQDLNGHGTHVAGIVGAEQYGVAPKSTLINVKVLDRDGNGSVEKIAVAINDITEEHNDNKKKYPRGFQFRGSIINMSLAWYGYSPAINTALKNAYYAGIPVIVASGNDYNRKKDPEPCSYIWTVCVGAVDHTYTEAAFSNGGSEIAYLAPGVDVLSLGIRSDNDLDRMTGTSQATPHVSGVAAIFTFWRSLANRDAANLLWWNALDDICETVHPYTWNTFVNTGIHSPKKYPKEPFRWAGDNPADKLQTKALSSQSAGVATYTPATIPSSDLATTTATAMLYTTLSTIKGLTTETGDTTFDPTPAIISPSVTTTGSVTYTLTSFSFNPTTSSS